MERNFSIYILLILSLIVSLYTSCDDTISSSKDIIINNNNNKNVNRSNRSYKSNNIYVKDVSKYDKSFIDGLINYSLIQKSYLKLIDDLLTV